MIDSDIFLRVLILLSFISLILFLNIIGIILEASVKWNISYRYKVTVIQAHLTRVKSYKSYMYFKTKVGALTYRDSVIRNGGQVCWISDRWRFWDKEKLE